MDYMIMLLIVGILIWLAGLLAWLAGMDPKGPGHTQSMRPGQGEKEKDTEAHS